MASIYLEILHLDKKSADAQSLEKLKRGIKAQNVNESDIISGEFGFVLEQILRDRVPPYPSKKTIGTSYSSFSFAVCPSPYYCSTFSTELRHMHIDL